MTNNNRREKYDLSPDIPEGIIYKLKIVLFINLA